MNKRQIIGLLIVITPIFCFLLPSFISSANFHSGEISNIESMLTFFDFKELDDTTFCSFLCAGLLCVSITLVLQLFIVCIYSKEESVIQEFYKEFCQNYRLVCVVVLAVVGNLFLLSTKLPMSTTNSTKLQTFSEEVSSDVIKYLFRVIYFSIISTGILMIAPQDDDVDLAQSQNDKCSIGALWANGAIQAYYEKSLTKFLARAQRFEEQNPSAKLLVRKLVLIAPLSCNIEGSLCDRDSEIRHIGDFEPIECDQGANINRRLINSVYEIYRDRGIYVAAEFPSPLGALWGERDRMSKDRLEYIRDCFLKELKEQLKSYPVIILEYDDRNPSTVVPLHQFINSSLQRCLEKEFYR